MVLATPTGGAIPINEPGYVAPASGWGEVLLITVFAVDGKGWGEVKQMGKEGWKLMCFSKILWVASDISESCKKPESKQASLIPAKGTVLSWQPLSPFL